MAAALLAVLLLTAAVLSEPLPGRVPKVYNALITSNQNLEPSKAFPVYQPVIHDPFGFPYQPVFYGGDVLANGLLPPHAQPRGAAPSLPPPPPPGNPPSEQDDAPSPPPDPPAESPDAPPADQKPENETPNSPAPPPNPPPEPKTESPIPLNQFGLPPQVLPLGPGYNGFTQVGPVSYGYPGYRFYDPYDFYNYNPYLNLSPYYRPLPNVLSPEFQPVPRQSPVAAPAPAAAAVSEESSKGQTPPSEPSDLNVLNYSSKDPSIPDVPPPPLPEGGLKSDSTESSVE